MGQYRYICTECDWGVHDTPFCPVPRPAAPRYRTEAEMRSLHRIWQLQDEGILPDYDEVVFRWRWLFYGLLGLVGFLVLMILL